MSELKPCPFCGDPMAMISDVLQHVTQTEGCPLKQMAWGHGAAINEWNTRATPTLSAAMELPEVKALVALLTEARADLETYVNADYPAYICAEYPDIARRHARDMELCRRIDAALAAVKEYAPTEYERKVAQMKKDFPNGI